MRNGLETDMSQYLADGEALAGYNADPSGEAFAYLFRLVNEMGDGDEDEDEDDSLADRVTKDVDVDIEGPFKDVKETVPDVTGGTAEKGPGMASVGADMFSMDLEPAADHDKNLSLHELMLRRRLN